MSATAISLRSESGDDYLHLFDKEETPEEMISFMETFHGEEWAYLSIIDVANHSMCIEEYDSFKEKVNESIEKALENIPDF